MIMKSITEEWMIVDGSLISVSLFPYSGDRQTLLQLQLTDEIGGRGAVGCLPILLWRVVAIEDPTRLVFNNVSPITAKQTQNTGLTDVKNEFPCNLWRIL